MRFVWATICAAAVWFLPSTAYACSVIRIPPSQELVAQADVIAIAVARTFISNREAAGGANIIVDPDGGRVTFEVVETLKGRLSNRQMPLLIQGRLADRDDFNETPVPTNWPRAEALGGDCFASTYRRDGTYLLLLKTTTRGTLTPYWSPLGRVNDQVHPERDKWVEWVRRQAHK